jgi:hypothetical protein
MFFNLLYGIYVSIYNYVSEVKTKSFIQKREKEIESLEIFNNFLNKDDDFIIPFFGMEYLFIGLLNKQGEELSLPGYERLKIYSTDFKNGTNLVDINFAVTKGFDFVDKMAFYNNLGEKLFSINCPSGKLSDKLSIKIPKYSIILEIIEY